MPAAQRVEGNAARQSVRASHILEGPPVEAGYFASKLCTGKMTP